MARGGTDTLEGRFWVTSEGGLTTEPCATEAWGTGSPAAEVAAIEGVGCWGRESRGEVVTEELGVALLLLLDLVRLGLRTGALVSSDSATLVTTNRENLEGAGGCAAGAETVSDGGPVTAAEAVGSTVGAEEDATVACCWYKSCWCKTSGSAAVAPGGGLGSLLLGVPGTLPPSRAPSSP